MLAGYALLLLLNGIFNDLERRQDHRQLREQLLASAATALAEREEPDQLAHDLSRLGLQVILTPLAAGHQPYEQGDQVALLQRNGQLWLQSSGSLARPQGQRYSLQLRQDIQAAVQRERFFQLLLIAAAGVSSLVTSGLLRPVLRRGLVQPLQRLSQQLDATQTPPDGSTQLAVESQPQELQPIARSFNQLQQRLAASWQRERSFVDGVAHELRTPITLIHGQAQSLLRHRLEPPTRQAVQQIDAEAQRMASLVSALLELARQDAGRLQLQTSALDPQEQLLIAYERLQPGSGGRLQLEPCDDDGPGLPLVRADADRLQQCLAALIDNALLYSPAPRPVRLAASLQADGVVLHVIDQGPGVSEAEKAQIFERFVRGSAAVDVRGSGIGLAVVQQLMAAMGGSVTVVAAPGGGADFQLRLPVEEG